ncbi:MAG: ATP-binding cassette domain-containing protein [Carbonactinosporaceae bacterium]
MRQKRCQINSAGKTTTLRMLAGLIRPSAGEAVVLGRPPGHPGALARLGAFIETPAFYPYLSGRDNLRALARMSGIPDQRVDFSLDLVALSGRGRDRFATYSLGMKQRVAVAAALLKDPELLILDEPTNGLDPAGMRDMRGLIRDLGTGGYTVLLSSHLLGEVQQICDRVGVIAGGRLVAEGSVDELRGHPELHVVAEPLDRARAFVERLTAPGDVRVHDGALRLRANGIDPGAVNRALVEAGLHVTELRRVEHSLEDAFFALTRTEEDVDVR